MTRSTRSADCLDEVESAMFGATARAQFEQRMTTGSLRDVESEIGLCRDTKAALRVALAAAPLSEAGFRAAVASVMLAMERWMSDRPDLIDAIAAAALRDAQAQQVAA